MLYYKSVDEYNCRLHACMQGCGCICQPDLYGKKGGSPDCSLQVGGLRERVSVKQSVLLEQVLSANMQAHLKQHIPRRITMMFKKVSVNDLKQNVFSEYENNWMIVTAMKPDGSVNGMTVSWGALGRFWEKPVATIYIRQSRYTKEFIDSQDYFTISMFDGHKQELGIYGSKSGRNCDKLAASGMHPVMLDGQPAYEESKCVFVCKKLYQDDFKLEDLTAEQRAQFYADSDYHTMYIAEITACYVNE